MPLVNDSEYLAFLAWKETFGAWHTRYGAMMHQEYPKWVGTPGEAAGRIVHSAEEEQAQGGRPVEAPLPQIAEPGKDYRVGDTVDFNGGYKIQVTSVTGGQGGVSSFKPLAQGHYDAGFTGTLMQSGTSGSGAGLRIASPVAHGMASPQDDQARKDDARQSNELSQRREDAASRPPMGQAPAEPLPESQPVVGGHPIPAPPPQPQAMPGNQAVHPPQPAPPHPPVQQTPAPAKS